MYDAIVVGARCAGSPTAMLLARKGYRVLLLDRATFPSDSWRQHFLRQTGVARLGRWGLLDRLTVTNCPPIHASLSDMGDFPLIGMPAPVDGAVDAYAPRRYILDKILVDGAVEAGVELREGFAVQELLWGDGRVTGIRGRAADGVTVSEQARIVIGADGLHSLVARAVGAPTYVEQPARACYYYSYWSGVPIDKAEVYWRQRRVILLYPTHDDLTVVAVGWPAHAFEGVRADIEGSLWNVLDLAPEVAEQVRAGRREEPFRGTRDLPNMFRQSHGPGWALAGDAGHHKDPYLGHGISDAFRDADLLAEALDAGFSGREPLDQALTAYQRRRDEESMPVFQINCQLAALEPPAPEQLALRAALRGNQADTDRYFGVTAGTVPVREFYAPANIERIMREAAATGVPNG
jgi:flavin-dependent dehydrogenase